MSGPKINAIIERMDRRELFLCRYFNRVCHHRRWHRTFVVVSRLGDGVIWYSLMLALLIIYRSEAVRAVLHMGVVGTTGLIIYKSLKTTLVRQRPFTIGGDIVLGTAPLDKYSFPSGHTLHAVGFSIVAISYFPLLIWILLPFTFLIALSRVVLGLHYPTDVLAGATIGATLAFGSIILLY